MRGRQLARPRTRLSQNIIRRFLLSLLFSFCAHRAQYEELKAAKDKAEEDTIFSFKKKKGCQAERKQASRPSVQRHQRLAPRWLHRVRQLVGDRSFSGGGYGYRSTNLEATSVMDRSRIRLGGGGRFRRENAFFCRVSSLCLVGRGLLFLELV